MLCDGETTAYLEQKNQNDTLEIKFYNFILLDTVRGYDKIWIIGDQFMSESYAQYFQNAFGDNGKINYMRAHYDVTGFCQASNGLNNNYISRIRNALAKGMNDQVILPRAVLLIFEEDLITSVNHKKPGISTLMGRLIEWLANQMHRMIVSHKEKLPSKSRINLSIRRFFGHCCQTTMIIFMIKKR